MRRILLAALAALAFTAPAHAASSYGTYPSCTGGASPLAVEAYDGPSEVLTTAACFPMLGTISGAPGLDVRTTTRNVTGTLTFVRWSQESTVKQLVRPNVAADVDRVDHLPFAASMIAGGWHELRVTSNMAEPDQRVFTTTRWCALVAGGSSNYCGGPTVRGRCGGGSWYGDYIISWIDCRDWPRAPRSGAWSARLRFDGERGVAQIDGRTIYDGAGGDRTVLVPAMPAGRHTLRVLSWHTRTIAPVGTFGGAALVPFTAS